jgi:flagellin
LEQVNNVRGDLGAISNRLDSTMNNLSNISENQAAARSRIEDADFARESANLSRAQVLQQAGTAMLAQANAAPQQVLSLLQ